MKRFMVFVLVAGLMVSPASPGWSKDLLELPDFTTPAIPSAAPQPPASGTEYAVGVEDVLDIAVIKPKAFASTVTVAPDGAITFPYIGSVMVKGLSLSKIQDEVQKRLADGYMEFPVVAVSLRRPTARNLRSMGK